MQTNGSRIVDSDKASLVNALRTDSAAVIVFQHRSDGRSRKVGVIPPSLVATGKVSSGQPTQQTLLLPLFLWRLTSFHYFIGVGVLAGVIVVRALRLVGRMKDVGHHFT